jgi:transcriptional regulator with XRE-family HTH domain
MDEDDHRMPSKAVADLVVLHRVKSGLTIQGAAQKAGVSRTTWTDIEDAATPVARPETLGRVAEAIGVDLVDLLVAARIISPPPPGADGEELRVRLQRLVEQVTELAARVQEQGVELARLGRRFGQGSG